MSCPHMSHTGQPPAAFAPFTLTRPLILASASPRRKELLAGLGIDFAVRAAPAEEPGPRPGEDPGHYALRAARAKAEAVCALPDLPPRAAVLAADTIVAVPEAAGHAARAVILGKPAHPEEALNMLRLLAGRAHRVYTACCLCLREEEGGAARSASGGGTWREIPFLDQSGVRFAAWPEPVLAAYAHCGEPDDKAGAYAVQGIGAFLVEAVEGSWSTVVGLPLTLVVQKFLESQVFVVSQRETAYPVR